MSCSPPRRPAPPGAVLYLVDLTRGYKNGPGQAAVHFRRPLLNLELAGIYGYESNQNNLGVRPVVDFHLGSLQVIAGMEYLSQSPELHPADKVSVSSLSRRRRTGAVPHLPVPDPGHQRGVAHHRVAPTSRGSSTRPSRRRC